MPIKRKLRTLTGKPLECEGDLRLSRYGLPSAKDYDGIHLRGKMAVQHYTGSLINVLLDNLPELKLASKTEANLPKPTSYANVLKNGVSAQQPRYHSAHAFRKKPVYSAQPQHVKNSAQPHFVQNGWYNVPSGGNTGNVTNDVKNPATGTNKTPLGANYHYNVQTQNRFNFSASGN